MSGFGGAVKLTGESEYRAALKKITQNLKEVSSQMKLVSSSYDKNDKSVQALTAKQNVLNTKLTQQKEKLNTLKAQYSAMSQQYTQNTQKHTSLVATYEKEKAELERIGKELGENSKEYQDQKAKVDALEQEVRQSTEAQEANEKAMSQLRTEMNNAEADINKTEKQLDKLGYELKEAEKAEEDAAKGADKLGNEMDDLDADAQKAEKGIGIFGVTLGNIIANVVTNAISKLKDLASSTIEAGMNFESSMSEVAAISGATGDDLEMLTETAKEFGSTTKFSASEAADGLKYMALAGWDAETSASALGGVLDLAAASGMDLAAASDMVTDYLSAFGMKADQSAYFADLLAYAQGNANTTAEGLGEAYKNCAANMNAAGQDIETTTAFLSMLANQGLKGSEAGTALNAVMRDMTAKMKDGKIAIGDTQVAVQDANGNYRDMTDIMKDVESATKGMGDAEKASALQSTFTADSIKGLNLILNAGVDEAAGFEEELRKSGGTAKEMAEIMQNNLGGDLTNLGSKFEGVQISIYEKFEPALRSGVKILNKMLDAVNFVIDHSSEFIAVIGGMAAGVGAYVAYTTAIKVMKDGWMALSVVQKAVAASQAALNVVMSANPIGIIIAAVVALVAAFVILWKKSEKFRNFWKHLWTDIKKAVMPIIKAIAEAFSKAWDFIKKAWDKAKDFFKGIWDGIKAVFSVVGTWFKTQFETAWNNIKLVWSVVTVFFKGIWTGIQTAFSGVASWFKTIFTNAWNNIKSAWSAVTGFFSGIWTNIKSKFSAVPTWFKDQFSKAWTNIKNVFSGWTSFFSGLWGKIKSTFSSLGTKLGSAIGGAVKAGINKVISLIQSTINKAIGLINGAIGMINKLPGVNVSKISKVSLPRLYQGGVLERGQVGVLEGSGAEAVVPLEKNTKWIKRVADSLRTELALNRSQNMEMMAEQFDYDSAVDAFKEALSDMQIILDDETAGKFVEKTVTRLIYT